jgi:hypothetical protein
LTDLRRAARFDVAVKTNGNGEYVGWSGNVRFQPARMEEPKSEADVRKAVERAADDGLSMRVAGAGHSFTPLLATDGVLLSTDNLSGLIEADADAMEASLLPGTRIEDAGPALREHGLTLIQIGDIDYQTVAGGIATATHGTGADLPHLGGPLIGGRFVNGRGEAVEFDKQSSPELVSDMRSTATMEPGTATWTEIEADTIHTPHQNRGSRTSHSCGRQGWQPKRPPNRCCPDTVWEGWATIEARRWISSGECRIKSVTRRNT